MQQKTELKKELRKKILRLRDSLNVSIRKRKDEKIKASVTEFIRKMNIKSLALYASFGSEVNTQEIFFFCKEKGIKTAFPKVVDEDLAILWVNSSDELKPGYKSILEPSIYRIASFDELDLILVPGVAFDERCYRIGYGGGFYDRLLKDKKVTKLGLAYEEQVVKEIPNEPFDIRVDLIITDERIISCV